MQLSAIQGFAFIRRKIIFLAVKYAITLAVILSAAVYAIVMLCFYHHSWL